MMQSSQDIRTRFLKFFEEHGHTVVPSSSLVPSNDPTLLFTNAGMVQFKDVFLGREKRDYRCAVTSQRCVRAGGKHNDLENVGYTARHHTFFEMLGNFSFGDYFKKEAICYAWEFVTETAALPVDKLWVTVFEEDTDAENIWLKTIGVAPQRVSRVGARDNFWSMGDVGPCGPCTEIFYDHGEGIEGDPPGSGGVEGDRYVEIWNLVFMQYERNAAGEIKPLPRPSVDTGMGLERMAAVLQGVHSNYDIDIFQKIMQNAAEIIGCDDLRSPSLRVIADHIRACGFLIADGVRPENEGRGYVLRRIIRRAVRHGHRLGMREPFFYKLIQPLQQVMGQAYPELYERHIQSVLRQEERRFAETLETGLHILEEHLADLSGDRVAGEVIFKLYDTYGFPVDLTADVARERNFQLDMPGFETLMRQQQARARDAGHFAAHADEVLEIEDSGRFSGYEGVQNEALVRQIFHDGEAADSVEEGDSAVVILDNTPFYAEAGGQVSDTGILKGDQGDLLVTDTRKQGDAHKHIGVVRRGRLSVGDRVTAQVDAERRACIVSNHSATHLLHAALKQVLGTHVSQKGSLVAEDRLRFDFSHDSRVHADELSAIESLVNRKIRDNEEVTAEIMSRDDALSRGAVALFGEKYGDDVRVLTMGNFSMELCGGTHVARTGDIGVFKIISESGVAAGVRRIEALTGAAALRHLSTAARLLGQVRDLLQVNDAQLSDKLQQLIKDNRRLKKQLDHTGRQTASADDLKARTRQVNGIQVLAVQMNGGSRQALRSALDQLKSELDKAAIVLAVVDEGKVRLVAGVSKELTAQIKAGELVNFVAAQVGGKGGGRADMAEAGGDNPAMLEAALGGVADWVRSHT